MSVKQWRGMVLLATLFVTACGGQPEPTPASPFYVRTQRGCRYTAQR